MRTLLIATAFALVTLPLAAQQPQRPQFGCKTAEHRQFDFWIGDWTVTGPNGNTAGKNTITLMQEGCVLVENWTGNGGSNGMSLNFYEAGQWHQVWVSNQAGGVLRLSGGLKNGAMVLLGERTSPQGKVLNRITWEKLDGGKVRQTWDTSTDNGGTWTTSFNGVYTRTGNSTQ